MPNKKTNENTVSRTTKHGTLFFNQATHRFWTEDAEGNKSYLKSVTRFTGSLDKPGLKYWSVRLMRDDLFVRIQNGEVITKEHIYTAHKLHAVKTQQAGNIGTIIHDWIDQWIDGKDPEIPEDKNAYQGVISFLEFQRVHNVKWLRGEFITWSPKYGYAGKPDRIAEIDGMTYLVDYKSSNSVEPEYAFQTSLYAQAESEQEDIRFQGRLVLRFAKVSEDEYYDELEKENALRKEFGDKPKEAKPYKIFEPVFFHENEKDLQAALALVGVVNRYEELKSEMKIEE